MFLGMKNVWRSKNIKHPERDSIVWQKISTNLMGNNSENMIAMRFSKADHRILYASKAQRRLARTLDAMADEVVWTNLSATLPSSLQPVNCIETHPVDTHTVYIGFNRDVWKSADGGLTWANLTADFPDVQINSIAMDTTSAWESLYIGTDQGIYYHDTAINGYHSTTAFRLPPESLNSKSITAIHLTSTASKQRPTGAACGKAICTAPTHTPLVLLHWCEIPMRPMKCSGNLMLSFSSTAILSWCL
jgi:hypothetical protein